MRYAIHTPSGRLLFRTDNKSTVVRWVLMRTFLVLDTVARAKVVL